VERVIAKNPKAFRDYEILEKVECGVELRGPEIKSLREAKTALQDSFARVENGEVFLYNMHISPYQFASIFNVEPKRKRKLLLRKKQIQHLWGKTNQRGFTLVPLSCYFNERGIAKIELGVARGKRFYERREEIKKKEAEFQIRKALRTKKKGGERSRLR